MTDHLKYWWSVLVIDWSMNLHRAWRISPAHCLQLQQEPGASCPRRHAIEPHLQLGGVSCVEEAGPCLTPPFCLKHRQLKIRKILILLCDAITLWWQLTGPMTSPCTTGTYLQTEQSIGEGVGGSAKLRGWSRQVEAGPGEVLQLVGGEEDGGRTRRVVNVIVLQHLRHRRGSIIRRE